MFVDEYGMIMKLLKSIAGCVLAIVLMVSVIPMTTCYASQEPAVGIDVSSWNGAIDWAVVAPQIDFAVLRVGSLLTKDARLDENVQGCQENGIPFGVYYYSVATSEEDAATEVAFILDTLEGLDLQLPVYVQFQDPSQTALPKRQLQAIAKTFCDAINQAGYQVGLYAYVDCLEENFSEGEFAAVAKWVCEVDVDQCTYTGAYEMWQYSWSGRLSGISGDVDMNYYYGDLSGTSCEHTYGYSFADNIHTFTCSACGDVFTKESTDGKKFAINSAAPILSDDIIMKYSTTVPAGFEGAYMVFSFNGEDTTVSEYAVNATNGRYEFSFPGLNPQKMGDNICATLYAYVDGVKVSVQIASYSVVKYCDNQLKKTTISADLRTALSDLLIYGECNQIYEGYKTDVLVTSLLSANSTLTPSTFPAAGLDSTYNKQKLSGTSLADCTFSGVTMTLGAKVVVRLTVTCTDISKYTFKATLNGVDYNFTGDDLVPTGTANKYYLNFDQIKANLMGDVITFTIWDGDTQVSRTLEYSVYTYVQKNQTTTSETLANLLKALYNYGEAVKKV